MNLSLSRDSFLFFCGACVVFFPGLGLYAYSTWPTTEPPPGPPLIVERLKNVPTSRRPRDPSASVDPADGIPKVDMTALLLDRAAVFKKPPAPYAPTKRLDDQANLLKAYEKDPEAFLKKYNLPERVFLFDAVIDPGKMVRVGSFADGGKWMNDPQSLKPGSIVYSFGVATEISFDTEMAGQFGCEVHAFDPSPSVERSFNGCQPGTPVGKGTFTFHPIGLGPVSLDPKKADDLVIEHTKCEVKRLSELATELKHDHVDVLKMDIEGGEMAALTEILTSGTLKKLGVKQLLVEFHLWDNNEHWKPFVRVIDLLHQQGYLIFRKELNPADGRCFELSFLGPGQYELPKP